MTAALVRSPAPMGLARVEDAPSFPDLVAMGEQLVRTGFLPDHIRTGPQFAAIVMTGHELGMTPMRAVRSLHMMKGKVIEDASSQLARFKAHGGRAEFRHLDDTKAVLWLRHPNGDEHVETWTTDDSKRAGLGGGNHGKFPRAMLRSRVITAGLKSLGWEGAIGAYAPGELDDDTPTATSTAKQVAEPEVIDAPAPPAAKQAPDMNAVLGLAEKIVDADDGEALAALHDRIGDVVGDSEKLSLALQALVQQRSAQLADQAWDGNEREQKAVAWLRAQMEARTTTTAQAA